MTNPIEVVVVSAARTPLGSFQGSLAAVSAPKLGAVAIAGALKRAGLTPQRAGELGAEVILGNVLAAGVGQAPARQALIAAGLPHSTPALTINKVCGSGMKAVLLGAQAIASGEREIVIAGGMESMSQAPYLIGAQARGGFKMGDQKLIDSMVHDGLWDPYHSQHMGNCAELCAREWKFTREAQDEYAIASFRRAQAAQAGGKFKAEIEPVAVAGRKGEIATIDQDEGPGKAQFDKIPTLKPVFDKQGSVTAANASTINDGAAALILMSREAADRARLKPLARIVASATHAQAPEWFTTAPGPALAHALKRAGWESESVDLWEVNEAFAVVAMAAERELKIPRERLNVWGGAISLGHPIGASGARIIVTLLHALIEQGKQRGLAGICIGGGEATAIAIERLG